MRIMPTSILLDVLQSQETRVSLLLDAATTARPRPTMDSVTRHPCRQEAFFLPCASRTPDFIASRSSFTGFASGTRSSSTRYATPV